MHGLRGGAWRPHCLEHTVHPQNPTLGLKRVKLKRWLHQWGSCGSNVGFNTSFLAFSCTFSPSPASSQPVASPADRVDDDDCTSQNDHSEY